MSDSDCNRAAELIRKRVIGDGHAEKIGRLVSGDDLRAMPALNVELAEADGQLIAYLTWQETYSTWRGLKGMYINDQYSLWAVPSVHQSLLLRAVARGLCIGAKYIRTEVDVTEEEVMRVYMGAGFTGFIRRTQHYLEAAKFSEFVKKNEIEPIE
jgi:hypothetical protein